MDGLAFDSLNRQPSLSVLSDKHFHGQHQLSYEEVFYFQEVDILLDIQEPIEKYRNCFGFHQKTIHH
jgi:hypothetical protein